MDVNERATLEAMALLDSITAPYEFNLSKQSINRLYYCEIYYAFRGVNDQPQIFGGRGETVAGAIQRAYAKFKTHTLDKEAQER